MTRLASILTALAGLVTGAAFARPGLVLGAHAVLLWAWAAIAWREALGAQAAGPVCLGCGRVAPGWLPDGSCMRCAKPRKPAPQRTA